VKISELSIQAGCSIPTIKYYLREGLLSPGRRTGTNQADYDKEHVRRLRLIRTLIDVGGVPIARVRDVLAAIDDDRTRLHGAFGVAHHALATRSMQPKIPADQSTLDEVDEFVTRRGWRVKPDAPGRRELADALTALRSLGWQVSTDVFETYARAADEIADWELTQTPVGSSRTTAVESVVIGTVVFESVLVALRRLAEEHHSAVRFDRAR
jgi:DNA-binding transcriptional MerR regulator